MPIEYQDYYKILGVERNASQDEIKNAYKKMAKKYHPDINKSKDAEDNFKKVNEAHEVLKDPEKRKLYDQFGDNWESGQNFDPSDFSGFGGFGGFGSGPGYKTYTYTSGGGGGSGFSDFFESIFGNFSGFQNQGARSQREPEVFRSKGLDRQAKMTLTVKEAYKGGTKTLTLNVLEPLGNGRSSKKLKRYQVNIPPGSLPGSKLRLRNMGEPGFGGGPAGDLLIEIAVNSDSKYRLEGKDIIYSLEIPFYDAILGSKMDVEVLDKNIEIKIPAGSQSNQKLRIKGMGMPAKDGKGDLFFEIKVAVPKDLTQEEKEYIQKARDIFNKK